DRHRRRGPPPADLRHYQPPGRREDHAHGEAPPVRRGHPPCREREGAPRRAPRHLGLDADGAGARHLRDLLRPPVRVPGARGQPAGHPGARGLLGRHVPHPDRGRQRGDAAGQPQGRGGADAAALRGLPPPAHAHLHLRQQVRPPRRGPAAAAGRRGARPGAEVLPGDLAHHLGRPLRGGVQPRHAPHPPVRKGRGPRLQPRGDGRGDAGRPGRARAHRRQRVRAAHERRGAAGHGGRGVQPRSVPARRGVAHLLWQRAHQFRGGAVPGQVPGAGPLAHLARGQHGHGGAGGPALHGLRVQDPGEHGSQAPRPHRLRAGVQRALRGGDAGEARAHGQGHAAGGAHAVPGPRAHAHRGSVARRRDRHPRPRQPAHRRHPFGQRRPGVRGDPAILAAALLAHPHRRPHEAQAARHGAAAALGRGRRAGVLLRDVRGNHAHRGRRGPAPVRRAPAPPGARVRRQGAPGADVVPLRALGAGPRGRHPRPVRRPRPHPGVRCQGGPARPLRQRVDAAHHHRARKDAHVSRRGAV
ncbi:MAG: Peptide chain release factor 3, partial [uncultured Gemmatimonadetes bacterium]